MEKIFEKLRTEEVSSKKNIKAGSNLVFSFFGSRCIPSVQ